MKWQGRVAEPEGVMVFDTLDGLTHYIELKNFAEFHAIQRYVDDEVKRKMKRHINTVEAMLTEMKK